MDEGLVKFGLTAFVTLLVVVDPPGVVPIFVALTEAADAAKRRAIVKRAVIVALLVALFFLVAGRSLLSYLAVTIHDFAISGGVLLFATALPMLFGNRRGATGTRAERAHNCRGRHCDLSACDPAPARLPVALS
jgi:multiple antibiotic resistance protein